MFNFVPEDKDLNFLDGGSNKLFQDLIERLHAPAFMADKRGVLFYVNTAFLNTFQIPDSNRALGSQFSDLFFMHSFEKKAFIEKIERLGFIHDFEARAYTFDKTPIEIAINCHFITNEQGQKIGYQGLITDISARKILEINLLKEQQKLKSILDFSIDLNNIFDIEQLSHFIVERSAQILEAQKCSLMLVDETTSELYIKASIGLPKEIIKSDRTKIGESIAGIAVLKNCPILVQNIDYEPLFKNYKKNHYLSRSFMSAPVVFKEQILGTINITDKIFGHTPFSQTDLKILEMIAKQAAICLTNAQLFSNLRNLAQTDSLTNLLNHRTFMERLAQEIERSKRYPTPLSLLMIDIDNFKIFNDTHGHQEGDHLLIQISKIFKTLTRASDSICRYGGDEFGIILPEADLEQALSVGEKLRLAVSKEFAHQRITLSAGVAEFVPFIALDEFVERADEALYLSKKSGRNKVTAYSTP